MFEQVKVALAKQLRIEEDRIKPEARIQGDLGADSLDIIQFLMTLEEAYGITVPDEDLLEFVTVKDVVDYLESRKN